MLILLSSLSQYAQSGTKFHHRECIIVLVYRVLTYYAASDPWPAGWFYDCSFPCDRRKVGPKRFRLLHHLPCTGKYNHPATLEPLLTLSSSTDL